MNYFKFSRKEQLGVAALSGIILILIVLLNIKRERQLNSVFQINKNTSDYFLALDSINKSDENVQFNNQYSNKNKPNLAVFDPNKIRLKDWVDLGFSVKQSESILSYRKNYGPFQRKEDLAKLYVISSDKFAEIEPYIQIENNWNQLEKNENNILNEDNIEPKRINLNQSTKEDLVKLKGIGPVFADRIIAFREKIGGFVSQNQIEQLYISEDAKAILSEKADLDLQFIRKRNINTATKKELKNIPYSNWTVVAAILKYREVEKIVNLDFLTESEISVKDKEKLQLYINF